MGKSGRPVGTMKYSASRLREAVDAYFDSISYFLPVTRPEPVLDLNGYPVLDKYGHAVSRDVPVITADGRAAQRLHWTEQPSVMALCLRLRIDKSTWARYASDQKLGAVVDYARLRIEAYQSALLEHKDTVTGAKFQLQCHHSWGDQGNNDPVSVTVRFDGGGDSFG